MPLLCHIMAITYFKEVLIAADKEYGKLTEYEHSRYLRNHNSYKKCLMNKIFVLYK